MLSVAKVVLLAFFFAVSLPSAVAAEHPHSTQHQSYDCPMHPEVTGVKGDSCPKCGMDLEPAAKSSKSACPNKKNCDKCPQAKHGHHGAAYDCPMHPEVTGTKGDSGPKCGMDLEPAAKSGKSACPSKKNCDKCPQAKHGHHGAAYDCPMHPEVTGTKGDSCPKCGMDLEPVKAATHYDCPMHPEVTGTKGDSCPKCGMDLEPQQSTKSHKHQHHG
ncbi:heavy metal-binding domain-containing protein [Shewanella sp. NIFS-20-20]|uniref:heavy metal-binding domain-containing protein n=1 Tax=Shewanella sp. NIFS-20-20 TaxID=2853806 RepID=UPI001C460B2B|nr:heavy metal-binding domain-containing protein [Shewanella sp. NIFS-20-20]MBV7316326.1 hypothetical protein [Shewanella sp. NIFS-20-20]